MTPQEAISSSRAGQWHQIKTGDETYKVFIPSPLPPNPPLQFNDKLQGLLEQANRAVGRLEGIVTLLPSPNLFIYAYVRKEAILSSQIEGTQSSLSELLLFENEASAGIPLNDVREVSNYVAAMEYGLSRMKKDFPLSLRLIREMHEILLRKGRGHDKTPGEFRRSQNWIGGTRPGNASYVPPPPEEVMPAMGALEKFLHNDPVKTSPVIKAGLVHAQFESIHPFLDGNGRLGRLLITLIMCHEQVLSSPLLYLSLYFKENRKAYYAALQNLREEGGWEDWMAFYLAGVEYVGNQASDTAKKLALMFQEHRKQIRQLGRASYTAERLHSLLEQRVLLSPSLAQKELKMSFPAANKALMNLQKLGFVREVTGKRKHRVFAYTPYLKVLTEGTEKLT